MKYFGPIWGALLIVLPGLAAGAAEDGPIACRELRCELASDPLGVDAARPRLGWMIRASGRGELETGYRILVASAPDLLERGEGDLWDSGKIESSRTNGIAYAGRALRSGQRVCWKVRVWEGEGRHSPWSPPAGWTMGILSRSEWHADWITDPDLLRRQRAFLGYKSDDAANPDTTKWVQLDLGADRPIDTIVLDGLRSEVVEGMGFPRRFKLEISDDPAFRTATMVEDQTAADFPNRWITRLEFSAHGAVARYVRLTATRLRVEEGSACLAMSRIEVFSEGKAVDAGAAVTASDSVERPPWSRAALADGLGGKGANPRANTTILLRREFAVKPGLRRALLTLCGLGGYVLELNGAPVGDGVVAPGWTDFQKTCLYDSFDVTNQLREGANAAGLWLTGGMYDVEVGRYVKFVTPVRPLTAIVQIRLEYADGSVAIVGTDGRWRTAPGPDTFSNVYGGEDYDARRFRPGWSAPGFDDSGWTAAVAWPGPGGALRGLSVSAPALRTYEELRPAKITAIRPGVEVYDLGQNAAVMLKLSVQGPPGSTVRVIPAELLAADGTVDPRSGGTGSWWQYTLAGEGDETWQPPFFYHGCRYLQVERTPAAGPAGSSADRGLQQGGLRPAAAAPELPRVLSIAGVLVHSSSPPVGEFACSNDLFNRIHSLVRWAQQSNMVSILTDCPTRERLGWLEQDHLNGPSLRYEFDLAQLFGKVIHDMGDAQSPDGLVPEIAPEYIHFTGMFRDSPEWGSASLLIPWQQYEWTGDLEGLRRARPMMKRYLDYLGSRASGHILAYGLGDWDDTGPGPAGVSQLTPIGLTATAIYYDDALVYARTAELLGRGDDARGYTRLAGEIKAAFNRAFYKPATGAYATDSQCSNAMPLALNLVEPEHRASVLAALVKDVVDRGYGVTAGDIGYRFVLRALADAGRSDVVAAMIDQSDRPGYGYQLERGATSLVESWTASRQASQDHFMLGQIMEWFYHDLAGIQCDPAGPGYARIVIRPAAGVRQVSWVNARYGSVRGPIACSWRRSGGEFSLDVAIPANATALVHVPAKDAAGVLEGGSPAAFAPGVRLVERDGGDAVFAVGSGHYSFFSELP